MNDIPLKDIHLPDANFWWPPALGWWLILPTLILLSIVAMLVVRWAKHQSLKKQSMREFKQITVGLDDSANQRELVAQLSTLLRRILMSYYSRETTAGLTGDRWTSYLNQLVVKPCFSDEQVNLLARGQFQRTLDVDLAALFDSSERWIKALPRERNNAST